MSRKAAIAIAVVFAFSAVAQAQTNKSRNSRSPVKKSTVKRTPSRTARPTKVRPATKAPSAPKVRVRIRSGNQPRHQQSRRYQQPRSRRYQQPQSRRYQQQSRRYQQPRQQSRYQQRNHQHQYREWVPSVYGQREVEVWVPPVYRTVHEGCRCHGNRIRFGNDRFRVGIQIGSRHGGHCEGRRVLVREGRYEYRMESFVVRKGYWRTRSSCLLCGHRRPVIRFRIGH